MTDELFFPKPLNHLYRSKETEEEVVLLYRNIQAFDPTPGAEYMVNSVLFMGEDEIPVCYPEDLFIKEYEVIPAHIELCDEA